MAKTSYHHLNQISTSKTPDNIFGLVIRSTLLTAYHRCIKICGIKRTSLYHLFLKNPHLDILYICEMQNNRNNCFSLQSHYKNVRCTARLHIGIGQMQYKIYSKYKHSSRTFQTDILFFSLCVYQSILVIKLAGLPSF